jgi:hypothetical protein
MRLKEADISASVRDLLEIHQTRGNLFFRRIYMGPTMIARGKMIPNRSKGLPDFLVWIKGGPGGVGFEIKSPTGKQSDSQKEFEAGLDAVGHDYFLIRSLEEAILILKGYGLT